MTETVSHQQLSGCKGFRPCGPQSLASVVQKGGLSLRSLSTGWSSVPRPRSTHTRKGYAPAPQRAPRLRSARCPLRRTKAARNQTTKDTTIHCPLIAIQGCAFGLMWRASARLVPVPPTAMTQWISSVLHGTYSQHLVTRIISDGLVLQVHKTRWHRFSPPYTLTLDLRSATGDRWTRVAELHSDSPKDCVALLGQIVTVARQCLANNPARTGAASMATV